MSMHALLNKNSAPHATLPPSTHMLRHWTNVSHSHWWLGKWWFVLMRFLTAITDVEVLRSVDTLLRNCFDKRSPFTFNLAHRATNWCVALTKNIAFFLFYLVEYCKIVGSRSVFFHTDCVGVAMPRGILLAEFCLYRALQAEKHGEFIFSSSKVKTYNISPMSIFGSQRFTWNRTQGTRDPLAA